MPRLTKYSFNQQFIDTCMLIYDFPARRKDIVKNYFNRYNYVLNFNRLRKILSILRYMRLLKWQYSNTQCYYYIQKFK